MQHFRTTIATKNADPSTNGTNERNTDIRKQQQVFTKKQPWKQKSFFQKYRLTIISGGMFVIFSYLALKTLRRNKTITIEQFQKPEK